METINIGSTEHKRSLVGALNAIFVPIIPALIGGGLVAGVGKMLQSFGVDGNLFLMQVLSIVGLAVYTYIGILVASNAAKYIGGSPILGAVAGMILINPALTGLKLDPGRGGVIAALFGGLLIAIIEKYVRKIAPKALKVHLPPFVSVLVAGVIIIYVLQPACGWLSDQITNAAIYLLNIHGVGGPIVSGVIAGLYLPLVMTGLHHGLTPLHLSLISTVGYSELQTLNSMAGGGQVGAALALLIKFKKDKKFTQTILGALPVGILGIGEPLIYGVTLPLISPFITSCLGAAVGGIVVGALHFGATAVYVSGILAIATNSNALYYILSYLTAVAAGFAFTLLLKFPVKKTEELELEVNASEEKSE